jgi:hypothetical protein
MIATWPAWFVFMRIQTGPWDGLISIPGTDRTMDARFWVIVPQKGRYTQENPAMLIRALSDECGLYYERYDDLSDDWVYERDFNAESAAGLDAVEIPFTEAAALEERIRRAISRLTYSQMKALVEKRAIEKRNTYEVSLDRYDRRT